MFRQENQKSMWKDNYYNICNGAAAGADVKPAIGRAGDIRKEKKRKKQKHSLIPEEKQAGRSC